MSSDPEPGTLRKLGAALLNATLMLVALVLVLAVVLVWQLRGLAQETGVAGRAEVARLEQRLEETQETARQALEALEARRDAPPAPGAIRPVPPGDALPADLEAVERALMGLLGEIATLRIAPLDPDTLDADDDSLMRWLFLVILRMIARDLMAPEV